MLLALGGTLLTALIVLLYKHYGIDSWSDLIREIKILKFKYDFALSQILIKKKKTNYLGMWKSSVTRFGNDIFLEIDKNRVYTYKQVSDMYNNTRLYDDVFSSSGMPKEKKSISTLYL